ncbi:HAD family hydrolase [Streptacidiphilus sp. PB12-B1b]|uniref:HAD family hydrolase n=1 Tax=Streptacidiphilus sp. PB12-B1b TaxID=2705012 RepID=UPI0015FBF93D|nr:HAD family hydrolase [Streptacidiphilus sp. PB12-B1b]QMU75711.1 HAD family hydrolase [Streptacidiphilus sp. PB12-B1b]
MKRLAFFDLDDTLVDRQSGFRECVHSFAADLDLGDEVEQWLLETMRERACLRDFEQFDRLFGVRVPIDELWARYCEGMAAAVSCAPEVLAGLGALRDSGWRVAVVTNGPGDIQRAKLSRTGIGERVDVLCISEEVGLRKPDPGIFARAAELCGVELSRDGWMVGDNPVNDIGGARAVGLRTIWISHTPSGETAADHVVPDARGALDILLSLPTAGGR